VTESLALPEGVVSPGSGFRAALSGSHLTITLNQPERRNVQTPLMWRSLARLGEWCGLVDRELSVIVVEAEGPSFSAGLDRAMFSPEGLPGEPSFLELGQAPEEKLSDFINEAQAGFRWFREVSAVSIAAVRGHAVGAGFQLALACDVIVAHHEALFAMRETSWGLVPDLGGTLPLVRGAGYGPALIACATGRNISAVELAGWGLALSPVEDPEATARELVGALQAPPPGAIADLKVLLRSIGSNRRGDQWERERETQMKRIGSLVRGLLQ
jgi:enoyl-CoA hydratase/carnithine racemase